MKLKIDDVLTLWTICNEINKLTTDFISENVKETFQFAKEYAEEHLAEASVYQKLEDETLSDIMDYLQDNYTSDDVLECYDKYDLKSYLRNNYDPDDFICMEWDY